MLNQIEIERIERYISGMADKNDTVFVETLFSKGQENFGLRNYLEKEWESDHQNMTPSEQDLNHMLDHVHHMIRNKENHKRKLFVHRLTHIYSKVAAILLLPLIIAGGVTFGYFGKLSNTTTEQSVSSVIHAPMGARVSFNLPDGTVGWLNSGSSLTYSLPFNDNRKITLDGEAWFDVVHNEKSPFEVSAGNSKVKVLGTSFNVKIVNDTTVLVTMIIEKESNKFIRKNSMTDIGSDGLMGNKLINISTSGSDSPIVEENDTLQSNKSVGTDEMLHTLSNTNMNVYDIFKIITSKNTVIFS